MILCKNDKFLENYNQTAYPVDPVDHVINARHHEIGLVDRRGVLCADESVEGVELDRGLARHRLAVHRGRELDLVTHLRLLALAEKTPR